MTGNEAPVLAPKDAAASLRARLRRVVGLSVFRGRLTLLLCLLAAFGGLFLGYSLGDIRWKFSREAREWISGGAAALLLMLLALMALRLRARRLDLLQAACAVEQTFPDLETTLSTSVEYTSDPARVQRESSEAIVGALVADAARRSQRKAFRRALNWRAVAWVAAVFALVAAAAVVYAAGWPWLAGLTFRRFVTPWRELPVPTLTQLTVAPHDREVRRMESVDVQANASGSRPMEAQVHFARVATPGADAEWQTADMRRTGDGAFVYTFPRMVESTRFYVTGGDAQSDRYTLDVYEPPRVTRMTLTLNYPDYTGLPPKVTPDALGPIQALRGTHVVLEAETNKPVTRGDVAFKGITRGSVRGEAEGPSRLRFEFDVTDPCRYGLTVRDERGRVNEDALDYSIRVDEDKAPTVKVVSPGRDVRVTKTTDLDLQAEAADDFGVARVGVAYRLKNDEEQRTSIAEFTERLKAIKADSTLYLENMDLADTDVLTYYLYAEDGDTVSGPKEGRSKLFFVEIRPFAERYKEGEEKEQGAGQGQKQAQGQNAAGEKAVANLDKIIERQKAVVGRTFELERPNSPVKDRAVEAADITSEQTQLGNLTWTLARNLSSMLIAMRMSEDIDRVQHLGDARNQMDLAGYWLMQMADPARARDSESSALYHLVRAKRDLINMIQKAGEKSPEMQKQLEQALDLAAQRTEQTEQNAERFQQEQLQQQVSELQQLLQKQLSLNREMKQQAAQAQRQKTEQNRQQNQPSPQQDQQRSQGQPSQQAAQAQTEAKAESSSQAQAQTPSKPGEQQQSQSQSQSRTQSQSRSSQRQQSQSQRSQQSQQAQQSQQSAQPPANDQERREDVAQRQDELARQTDDKAFDLRRLDANNPKLSAAPSQDALKSAAEMREAAQRLREQKEDEARDHGEKAAKSLDSALREAQRALENSVADRLRRSADKAREIAQEQSALRRDTEASARQSGQAQQEPASNERRGDAETRGRGETTNEQQAAPTAQANQANATPQTSQSTPSTPSAAPPQTAQSPQDRQSLSQRQASLQNDVEGLAQNLRDLAPQVGQVDPRTGRDVEQSRDRLDQGDIQKRMADAAQQVEAGDPGAAQREQQQAAKDMADVARQLSDASKRFGMDDDKRLAEAAARAEDLSKRQGDLNQRMAATEARRGDAETRRRGETAQEQQPTPSAQANQPNQTDQTDQSTRSTLSTESTPSTKSTASTEPTPTAQRSLERDTRDLAQDVSRIRRLQDARVAGDVAKALEEAAQRMDAAAQAAEQAPQEAAAQGKTAKRKLDESSTALQEMLRESLDQQLAAARESAQQAREAQRSARQMTRKAAQPQNAPGKQQAQANAAADAQSDANAQAQKLESSVQSLAQAAGAAKAQGAAESLKSTLDQMKQPDLQQAMRQAEEAVRAGRLPEADAPQAQAEQQLDRAAQRLKDLYEDRTGLPEQRLKRAAEQAKAMSDALKDLADKAQAQAKSANGEPTTQPNPDATKPETAESAKPGQSKPDESKPANPLAADVAKAQGEAKDLAERVERLEPKPSEQSKLKEADKRLTDASKQVARGDMEKASAGLNEASKSYQAIGEGLIERLQRLADKADRRDAAREQAPDAYRDLVRKYYEALSEN